jgi:ribonuclease BN (tRNA processing enzyme)
LPSQRTFHTITEEQYIISGQADGNKPHVVTDETDTKSAEVCVYIKFTQSHPLNGAILYRIEYAGRRMVYATDVEWKEQSDPNFLAFAEGADLLVHDAQYTSQDYQQGKRGFGHSTVEMATSAARAASVGQLVLFHHEPTYDDVKLDAMEALARTQFAHARSAYEGMEIDLLAPRTNKWDS